MTPAFCLHSSFVNSWLRIQQKRNPYKTSCVSFPLYSSRLIGESLWKDLPAIPWIDTRRIIKKRRDLPAYQPNYSPAPDSTMFHIEAWSYQFGQTEHWLTITRHKLETLLICLLESVINPSPANSQPTMYLKSRAYIESVFSTICPHVLMNIKCL